MTRACLLILTALLSLAPLAAAAQGLFSPYLIVNDRVISVYEYEQRLRMLTLFSGGRGEGLEEAAIDGLVEDRLRLQAAEETGVSVTPEQVRAGMEEFAARANLSAEQFLQALAQNGVDEATFRDFVNAGLLWRFVVRERFAPRVSISDVEVDRAIATGAGAVQDQLVLSEIVLPGGAVNEAQSRARANIIRRDATDEASFAAAARAYSVGPTAAQGGQLPPQAITLLPEDVVETVRRLAPGQISVPIYTGGQIVLYFLRGVEPGTGEPPAATRTEYARLLLPAGRDPAAEAARVTAAVDSCEDLYTVARGQPEGVLSRETRDTGALPADLAADIARLDVGETALVTRAGQPMLLMLCARTPAAAAPTDRAIVRNLLLNQRLAAVSDIYLEELRQAAIIREP